MNTNGNPYEGSFVGKPGPNVDGAWRELLKFREPRFPKTDIQSVKVY